jgi:hypothetical protein
MPHSQAAKQQPSHRLSRSFVVILVCAALVWYTQRAETFTFPRSSSVTPTPAKKNIIAYSLFGGSNPRYNDGAIANVKLAKTIFLGWTVRIYHDESAPQDFIRLAKEGGAELIDMSGSVLSKNQTMWRLLAASDASVGRFCCRDADSRLSAREKAAVDQWVASGKAFHVMRDHPSHSKTPMKGGMWCGTHGALPDIEDRLKARGQGMDFLNAIVWPFAQKSVLQHDSFFCDDFGGGYSFPTPREGGEHVGSVYVDGKMRQGDVEILMTALEGTRRCASGQRPFSMPCKPEEIWRMMAAGEGKWNCGTGEWEMGGCQLAPEARLPSLGCPVLTQFDRIAFFGDSVIRQFYQGTLIQVSGDKEFGSLQGAENTDHRIQWQIPEQTAVNFNHDWTRPPPAHCKGLENQFLKTGFTGEREGVGCGDGVVCGNCYLHLANTTGQAKYCAGNMHAHFFWAWNADCEGEGGCLMAHILHTGAALARGERVLLVTGVGLHDDCNAEKTYSTYMQPIMNNFYEHPAVSIVWHMISAAGAAKPAEYQKTQGNAALRKFNGKMREYLTKDYPRVSIFDPFEISLAAEQQCPGTMTSTDGTHAAPLVNVMEGSLFLHGAAAIENGKGRPKA